MSAFASNNNSNNNSDEQAALLAAAAAEAAAEETLSSSASSTASSLLSSTSRTIVSTSNSSSSPGVVPSELLAHHQQQQQQQLKLSSSTTTTACANRAAGLVCVCATCEAARTRLLHRCSNNKIAAKKTTTTTTTDDDDDVAETTTGAQQPSSKRARTTLEGDAVSADAQAPGKDSSNNEEEEKKLTKLTSACRTILECIGEDPEREGLLKTPERWARSLQFLCSGYALRPSDVTNGAVFQEEHHEMVVLRNVAIHSLCEHHMVPFTGQVHIGYIPNGKILGLSKLARIAELYARRLQVQERLTRQICNAIVETIEPLGVAVVVECTHFCMVMRGVQKVGAVTTTSSVRGCFETNPKTRAEFFSILHGGAKMC